MRGLRNSILGAEALYFTFINNSMCLIHCRVLLYIIQSRHFWVFYCGIQNLSFALHCGQISSKILLSVLMNEFLYSILKNLSSCKKWNQYLKALIYVDATWRIQSQDSYSMLTCSKKCFLSNYFSINHNVSHFF